MGNNFLAKEQIEILELLAKNEETISGLYFLYSKKFSDYRDFWEKIAKEEIDHAKWIRELYPPIIDGKILYDENRFKKEAVITFVDYINDEVKRFKENDLPLIVATSIALSIEESIIESKFFKYFESDHLLLHQTMVKLSLALKDHVDKVKKLLLEIKK